MKIVTIIFFSCFVFITGLSSCNAGALTDTTDGLPSVINLGTNPSGVFTINKPSGLKWFEAAAVADVNRDGYDDIIALGSTLDQYTATNIYIIFGSPHLPVEMNMDNPSLKTSTISWNVTNESLTRGSLVTGDINGDKLLDLIIPGDKNDKVNQIYLTCLYAIPGKTNWGSQYSINDNNSDFIRIYALPQTQSILQFQMAQDKGSCAVTDMNGDGIDDVIFSYPGKTIMNVEFVGEIYIVYGNQNMPSEINAENTTFKVTKIQGDTIYSEGIAPLESQNNVSFGFSNIAVGDLDGDHKADLVTDGGVNRMFGLSYPPFTDYSLLYGLTYVIYGQVLSAPQYTEPVLDLRTRTMGLTTLTSTTRRDPENPALIYDDFPHKISMGDINGDGYDDLFLGYYLLGGYEKGTAKVYILFGSSNFLFSGNIDSYSKGIVKISSAYKGDRLGYDFAHGDVNGDGFSDFLIGTQANQFYVLYGKSAFPDSFQMGEGFPYGSTIKGGSLVGCGDINSDGYQDIVGNKADGNIFVILGKGKTHVTGETIVKPLPVSSKSNYTFAFSDSSQFHFHFTYGAPSYNSEVHLTNFGNRLPDSLQSIPTSQKVVSFIQAELTNMSASYSFRVKCSIDYTDSALSASGIKERDLVVSTYNEQKSKWEKLETSVDTTLNRATFEVDHLSLFALTDKNDSILTGIQEASAQIPLTFELFQNYPNPFNPVTTIKYQLPKSSQVTLKIYNILGQEVKTVISEQLSAGIHEIQWDGTNNFGQKVSTGIYIYRMETNTGFVNTRKMVFLK